MATVDKNFRIKHGLVVEGTTATVNGNNVLTENSSDQYILDLIGGETLVKSVDSATLEVNGSGQLSIKANTFDSYGSASQALSDANDYADGLASNYDAAGSASAAQTAAQSYADTVAGTAESNAKSYADGLASNYDAAGAASAAQANAEDYADTVAGTAESNAKSYADGLAVNYDAAGSASAAQTAAQSYADGLASNYDAAGAASTAQSNAEDYADGLASNYDPAGAATTAEGNANDYTDTAISNLNLSSTYDALGAASQALSDANDYTDTAVSNLVGLAPSTLDTLQELAAAFDNSPDTLTNLIDTVGGKQGTLTASTGITIDGSNNISVTANTYDAYGAASTAQGNAEDYAETVAGTAESNAKSYADGLASNYDAAGAASTAESNAATYAEGLVNDVTAGDTAFTAVNVNAVAGVYAATTNVASASTVTAWSFDSATFTSAKLLVKFKTAAHSQISDVLLTLDGTGNVAITEYGIVGTNGSLGDVTAINSSGTINIRVTTAYANTDVMVYATAII